MIIGWVHDYRLEECLGGAELTNERLLQFAPGWADVVRCFPGDIRGADVYILHNVTRFSPAELARVTSRPYIHFPHDYWDTPQVWQEGRRRQVSEMADALIFLSELHRDNYLKDHRVKHDSMHLVPSAIDPEPFTEHDDQSYNAFYIGALREHKGLEEVIAWASENGRVDVYGWGPHKPQGKGVVYKGAISPGDVPAMMGRYRKMVFFPQWPEPFGRTVAEAVMSGCEVVGNGDIGALTWGFEAVEDWRQAVGMAHKRFWEIVEGVWR